MDGKILARIVAVIFVAVAITTTALEMTRQEEKPLSAAPQAPAISALNPMREGLRHCQSLGEAALRDGDCLRLWAEQRDRFLGSKAPFARSTSEPVTPRSSDTTTPEAR